MFGAGMGAVNPSPNWRGFWYEGRFRDWVQGMVDVHTIYIRFGGVEMEICVCIIGRLIVNLGVKQAPKLGIFVCVLCYQCSVLLMFCVTNVIR